MVAQTKARCVGEVIEAAKALFSGRGLGTGGNGIGNRRFVQYLAHVAIGLVNAEGAHPGITGIGKYVTHILKENKAQGVAEVGKRGRRKAKLSAVNQRSCSADRIAGLSVSRAGRIDRESAQG